MADNDVFASSRKSRVPKDFSVLICLLYANGEMVLVKIYKYISSRSYKSNNNYNDPLYDFSYICNALKLLIKSCEASL